MPTRCRAGLLLLAILIVTSCSNTQGGDDRLNLLQPSPCAPPCWQNITPGETQFSEAIGALESNPWVDRYTVPFSDVIDFKGAVGGYVSLADGVVDYVYIPVYNYRRTIVDNLQLDNLLQLYGPPLVGLHAEPTGWSRTTFTLRIAYPQRGLFIVANFEGTRDADPPIPSDMSLYLVYYVSPESFFQNSHIGESPDCLIPWDGYREASFYCKSPCVPPGEIPKICPPNPSGLHP